MQDGGWAWGLLTPLMIFIVFAAIIVGIVFLVILVRKLWGSTYGEPESDEEETLPAPERVPVRETPLEIVRRRYALGEIDRKEYLQKVKDLTPQEKEAEEE